MRVYLGLPLLAAVLLSLVACQDNMYPFDQVGDPFDFTYTLSQGGSVDILVLNSYVVTVRTLMEDSTQSQGDHTCSWDLLDADGSRVRAGLYYIRIILDDLVLETRMYEVYR